MDIYTDHRISFNAGVWARANKFNPVAVQMVGSLQLIAKLKEQQISLECQIEVEEQRLAALVHRAEQKQQEKDNA